MMQAALAAIAAGPACDRVRIASQVAGTDGIVTETESGEVALSPITDNASFYIYYCCELPDVTNWWCGVRFGADQVARFDEATLATIEPTLFEATLECIGSQPGSVRMGNAIWGGISLGDLLDLLGVTPPESAVEMRVTGLDGYDAALPVEIARDGIWVVWQMNGEPLTLEHGAPCRLIVPGRYGIKNIKWVSEIAWEDGPVFAFWDEFGGWSHHGLIQLHGYILVPARWDPVVSGPLRLLGAAFAGTTTIARVEVSTDGGPWEEAVIDYSPGADIWTLWHFDTNVDPGEVSFQVRVTDANGETSLLDPAGTDPLIGYDAGQLTTLVVT